MRIARITICHSHHDILELFLEVLQVLRRRFFSPAEENSRKVFLKVIQRLDYYVGKVLRLEEEEGANDLIKQLSAMLKMAFCIEFQKLLNTNRKEKDGSDE